MIHIEHIPPHFPQHHCFYRSGACCVNLDFSGLAAKGPGLVAIFLGQKNPDDETLRWWLIYLTHIYYTGRSCC